MNTAEATKTIQLEYNKAIKLEHGNVAEMRKTNEGSNSQVVIKNLSSQNTITISITLGKDGSTQKIAPKEELFFHDTPSDFDGKVLQIFNQTSSQHAGTAEITVNGVR
ncbi:hypothetical protein AB6D78_24330 [Vibrio splendidus]